MSNTLLMPPRATPSKAQNSSTNTGLMTRLNELTIDRTNAPSEARLATAMRPLMSAGCVVLASIDGLITQVIAAVTITTASEIAVFWTTESIVIGPPVATGAGACAGWPG